MVWCKLPVALENRLQTTSDWRFLIMLMRMSQFAAMLALFAFSAFAQQAPGPADRTGGEGKDIPQDHRPGLFYREDFKGPPKGIHEMPVTQAFLANPNLELKLYGPGG